MPEVPWEIGQDYRIVTISFDSTSTPELASEARNTYLSKGNLPQDTDWTSLIGEQKAIDSVTNAPGFFTSTIKNPTNSPIPLPCSFFQPLVVYSAIFMAFHTHHWTMRLSLTEAAERKISTLSDWILLTCFHYNPTTEKYDGLALRFLNVIAYVMLFVLVSCIEWWVFKEARSKRAG